MARKFAKNCEACYEPKPSRFRTECSRYLCVACYGVYRETGAVPEPGSVEPVAEEVEVRW